MIRYPMIYLMIIVHLPALVSYAQQPTALTFIGSFVDNGLIRLGVPMLTCISGFLIFHKSLDLQYSKLIRTRFASLVSPLLIWNIPLVLILYVIQSQGLIEHDWTYQRTIYPFEFMTWLNGILAITDYPINPPMHFLRDLFLLCVLAPGLGMLIRNVPFLGLAALLAVFVPNLDGMLIRNDTMIIMFYLGGMAAVMKWDIKALDKYAITLILLQLSICASVVLLDIGRPFWVALLAPFVIWPASSLFVGSPVGRWLKSLSRSSIFLFMIHGLVVSAVVFALPNLYDGKFAFFAWLVVPVVIALGCQIIYLLLERFFPATLTLLMGGRKVRGQTIAQRNSVRTVVTDRKYLN